MTTFTEFKAYLLRSLWRTGDTELEADLDRLIREAEARITRDLRHSEIQKTAVLSTTSGVYDLPDDYVEAVSVNLYGNPNSTTLLHPTTLAQLRGHRTAGLGGNVFAIEADKLHTLHKATATRPYMIEVSYYYKPVPYENEPDQPYYDDYPDFYKAAVNVQCYQYLREFELSAEYNSSYARLLEGMENDSARKQFPSGPIVAPLPGTVA